jgi:hypothetical protein
MKNLYFDNSNEMWFITGDPALVKYDQLGELFGSSQYLVVGIDARENEQSVFTKETLQTIATLHTFLENHESVVKVSSLSNYQYLTAENDVLTVNDLIDNVDTLTGSAREMRLLEEIMSGESLVHDYLVTKDMRHTVILAKSIYKAGEIDHQVKLIHDLNAYIDGLNLTEKGYKIRLAGSPVIAENFLTASMKDAGTTMPLMFALTILFLWLAFRRFSGLLMPLIVIFGSVIGIIGFIGAFGWALNSMNSMLPVILIAIGIGDSVHIIVEYYHGIDQYQSSDVAARNALNKLFIPCFNTSLTTALGFLSVATTHLRPLREFGIIAAIGVMVAFLLSVATLPAILSFFHPRPAPKQLKVQYGLITKITQNLTSFSDLYKIPIILISLVVIATSFWFTLQINVDTNFVNNFKESSRIRQDMVYFDGTYNGGYNLEFIVDSGTAGGIKNPEFLKEVMRYQDYLETLERSGKANSMLNYLKKMYQVMNNNQEPFYRIPDTRELVAQLLLLYTTSSPEEDLTDLISFDERFLRISLKIRNMPTSQMQRLVDTIETYQKQNFPTLKAELAGDTILWNNMSVYIQEGIVRSFSIAFLTIIICFFILFRSFKYGLLSTIPSLVPILVAGGIMGYLGIDLDFSTMMVAAVCFGIAVDDTIHIINRYITARSHGNNRRSSIHIALTESGRAIIFTSLILYFGFSVMLLSTFVPNIYFGIFSGVILIMALVANLVLLPAVMLLFGDKD